MTPAERFRECFDACPLVAIIRGVTPAEVEAIGQAIWNAGIRIIEVPLNSPEPLASIERLASRLGEVAMIGAGTVLNSSQVADVAAAGGALIVSPNMNPEVISASVGRGLISCPGIFTPTEAFAALAAGAHALKVFPAEAITPEVVKAQRAVLPRDVPLIVVGGVKPEAMRSWRDAGADGFGLGSGVYVPGRSPAQTGEAARRYVEALNS